jgi:hypothetical protein
VSGYASSISESNGQVFDAEFQGVTLPQYANNRRILRLLDYANGHLAEQFDVKKMSVEMKAVWARQMLAS